MKKWSFMSGDMARGQRRAWARRKKKPVDFNDLTPKQQEAELDRQKKNREERLRKESEAVALAMRAAEYATRTPRAFGYGRVSHSVQAAGESINSQQDRVQKFFENTIHEKGVTWGGFISEKGGVSAFKTRFFQRAGGRALLSQLKPGDHLIVDKLDRLWRSVRDFTELLEWFKAYNVTLHIVNLQGCQMSMDTPMGDFMLTLFVMLAQLESQNKSERLRVQFQHSEHAGYWQRKGRPPGTTVYGNKPRQQLKWNWDERRLMGQIVKICNEQGGFLKRQVRLRRHANSPNLFTLVQEWLNHPDQDDIRNKTKLLSCRHWSRDSEVLRVGVYELYYRTIEHPSEVPVLIRCLRRGDWKLVPIIPCPENWYERQRKAEMLPWTKATSR